MPKSKKVHLIDTRTTLMRFQTARCGVWINGSVLATKDREAVTCGNCKRFMADDDD